MKQILGRRLRQARDLAGLTQMALAARAGCDQSDISDYERGVTAPLSTMLYNIAVATGQQHRPLSWRFSDIDNGE